MSKLKCRGIGVVIDDRVPLSDAERTKDAIGEIVNQLQSDGISLLKYREIPPESEWDNFGNVAFLLIDWSLIDPRSGDEESSEDDGDSSSDVDVDNEMMVKQICRFIKTIHSKAFAPIFIFSNQDDGEIKQCLKGEGIEVDVPNAYVLVKPKVEMKDQDSEGVPKLFCEINSWIHATPTINLFATWGGDVLRARNQMFSEFYDKSHDWPSLLWNAYKDDNDDPAHGLSQVMFDNLKARVRCNLDDIPTSSISADVSAALLDVLGMMVVLPSVALPGQIGCGDLFEIASDENGQRFNMVVSCDCDCIVRSKKDGGGKNGKTDNEQYVQVLEVCHPIARTDPEIKSRISPDRGYKHKATESYIFPIKGQCFKVCYKTLKLILLEDFNLEKRVGRVLPPYITDIRQRLAQWNQRVGFPKLPAELFARKDAK